MNSRGSLRAAAIMFDLDGVLVDSMPAIRRYWLEWGRRRGIAAKTVLQSIHLPAAELVAVLAPSLDASAEAASAAAAYQIAKIPATPGSRELLQSLPRERWAIVTSAARTVALKRLNAAGLPEPRVLIAGEDSLRGKPEPFPYQLAAWCLGAPVSACVAVEDSLAGIQSAIGAGMHVIAVAVASGESNIGADAVISSLRAMRITVQPNTLNIDVKRISRRATRLQRVPLRASSGAAQASKPSSRKGWPKPRDPGTDP
jgi:mannitol-1-/sugar-/sorbitol-6-phosphatase